MKRQVIIIGGGTAYDSYAEYFRHLKGMKLDFSRLTTKRWKDSFAQKLGPRFQVVQPQMPSPNNAKYAEWEIWFRKVVPFVKRGAVLVGHSLGGIFLVKYLATRRFPKHLKAVVLVSAPFHTKDMDESLGDFGLPRSLRTFEKQAGRIFIYHSTDDPVVPVEHAEKYHQALPGAAMRIFRRKAHFNQATFPELVREIKGL